jgi:hypothetical protein
MALFAIALVALGLLAFDVLAYRFGPDQRDADDWTRHPAV